MRKQSDSQPLNANLLNTRQAAAALGYCTLTLRRWRQNGVGPKWGLVGRKPRYRLEDLKAYVEGAFQEAKK